MSPTYTTINNIVIPYENIDYISPVERPYTYGYTVYMKSGNKILVGSNDSAERVGNDRKNLIFSLNEFLKQKNDSGNA